MSDRSTGNRARVPGSIAGSLVAFIVLFTVGCGGSNDNGDSTVVEKGLKIGVPILDKKNGTALLPVAVPGSGTLLVRGTGVVHKQYDARERAKNPPYAATLNVEIEAKGAKKAELLDTGKVTVAPFIRLRGQSVGAAYHFKLKKD
jgi:hypothetical protein